MERMKWLVALMDRVNGLSGRIKRRKEIQIPEPVVTAQSKKTAAKPTGTFTQHITPEWLKEKLTGRVNFKILVWRIASVRFNAFCDPALAVWQVLAALALQSRRKRT